MLTLTLLLAALGATHRPSNPAGPGPLPSEEQILRSLRAEHPRLLLLPDDLARIKKLVKDDPHAAAVYRSVKRAADKMLTAKPIEHKLIGPRLLDMSRRCLEREFTLALMYRIDGDRRYAERAIQEMLTAAAFEDWNPKHFLDVAEMTNALAVGYDWLYDVLTPEQRRTIGAAILTKGLREAERVYRSGKGWCKVINNWNQVCNGGITVGALALADEQPQLAAWIVHQAVESVPLAMSEYAPDGGWGEGPGYWGYATTYNVYMIAALESGLGTDFGLSRIPGFSKAGDFRLHSVGPTKQTFNFADSSDGAGHAPVMLWLARKFDQPLYAWQEREYMDGSSAEDLMWYDGRTAAPDSVPTDRWFHHVDVAFLRSAWNDPRALYVGFKGGDNAVNHSHLQLGTFVLDALGQRWVLELGSDDYNLPGYFGDKRWTYYRLSTRGQNTLLLDGQNQDPRAVAPVTCFLSSPERSQAIVDLTAAYPGQARQVLRGIAMLKRRRVLVQDELLGPAAGEVVWQIHTKAKIDLHGPQADMQLGGEKLTARMLAPPGAQFTTEQAAAPSQEHQQPDVQRLMIKIARPPKSLRIAVLFTPADDSTPAGPVQPLRQWQGRRK